MNKAALNAWAKPLMEALQEIEALVRKHPGDVSMLNAAEEAIRSLPLPDYMALAEDMAGEMEQAAGKEISTMSMGRQRVAAFAAINPGFEPLADAIRKIAGKTPITSKLRSADWEHAPLAFRERGQFSSGVESIRVMGSIQSKLLKAVSHQREIIQVGGKSYERHVSRDSFIRDIRQAALDEGLDTGKGNVLTNIAAPRRIGLIYDMQNAQAAGYARWKLDNSADALAILPAWRLGESSAKNPRDWTTKWQVAGNAVGWEGASRTDFVALKTSPIWMKLSRFGTPWPPFDWGSTRELEDVWRDEAERLGLVGPDDVIEPTMEKDFNAELEASVSDWRPEMFEAMKDAFGDQVDEKNGKAHWRGNLIGDLSREIIDRGLDTPFDSKAFKGRSFNLGFATDDAVRKAAAGGVDIKGKKLVLTPDTIYHMLKRHGEGREKDGSQRPLTVTHIEIIPHVWKKPDRVRQDDDGVRFEKKIMGREQVVVFDKVKGVFLPVSVRVKKM
ncbi:MAG TPA: hypothetical protein PJ991_13085 [Kiritimatiellia bacterium]|nr:hypothetical protein [Kiritimatiellia bacterium]